MVLLLKLKQWAWQIGAVLLAIAAVFLRVKTLKYQRDKARVKAAVAEARVHIGKAEKRIAKKEKENLSSSLEEVERKVKEKKFEDLKNLTDPNNPSNW